MQKMKRETGNVYGAVYNTLRVAGRIAAHPVTLFCAVPVLVAGISCSGGPAGKPSNAGAEKKSELALPFSKSGGDTMFAIPAQDSSLEFARKLDGFVARYSEKVNKGEILASLVVLDAMSQFVKQQKDAGKRAGIDPETIEGFGRASDALRLELLKFAKQYYEHPESQKDDARPFEMLQMYLWNYLNLMDNLAIIIGGDAAKGNGFMIETVLNMAVGLNGAYGTGMAKNPGQDWQDRERLKVAIGNENQKRGLGLDLTGFVIK